MSPVAIAVLTGTTWFPTTLANAFMPSLRISFYIGALLSVIAAVLASMTGSRLPSTRSRQDAEKKDEKPEPAASGAETSGGSDR